MPGLQIDLSVYEDEEALLEGLRRGEQAACACLVKRFAGPIYNVALRLMGNGEDAEEVLQETFISACDKIDSFERRSSLGTWLYRIATNAALMRLRKKQLPTVPLDQPVETVSGDELPRHIVDWSFDPAGVALNDELRQELEAAVASLPETLRVVFILRDVQGLSTAEVAETLGISQSAAKVRLHRARLRLREQLSRYFASAAD
ncbi:MAG TPA: sigma-70 family RNA polymerase sigma factor [Anaerolineae bacterium]|nr:sigma-70 family RNA polymerase sigma factor [Anaerolineae bacterium]